MKLYVLIAAILFLFLGLLWNKDDNCNFFVKLMLFGFGVWGLVLRFGAQ